MIIPQIQIPHRQLFNNFSNALYDVQDDELGNFNLLNNLKTPDGIVQLFKDGHTIMMVDDSSMQCIDEWVASDIPFIIFITQDEKSIFAIINGTDVNY